MLRALATARRAAALAAVVLTAAALPAQQFPTKPPAPLPVTAAQMPPFQSTVLPSGLRAVSYTHLTLPTKA